MAIPHSSAELIDRAADDDKRIQDPAEFWQRLHHLKFSEHYRQQLLESGIERGKADEIGEVVRHYIEEISASLEKASYLLRQLEGELADAARRAWRDTAATGFQV